METLKHKVEITPYPAQRPRLSKYGVHNSTKYTKHKSDLTFLLKSLRIEKKNYEYLRINFFFPYPASEPKKNRVDNAPYNRKYDLDNLIKTFMDALTQSGIIEDDRFICGFYAEKLFTTKEKGWIEFEFE
jgi:Holliday junction resolvase RusA-like endonuclease